MPGLAGCPARPPPRVGTGCSRPTMSPRRRAPIRAVRRPCAWWPGPWRGHRRVGQRAGPAAVGLSGLAASMHLADPGGGEAGCLSTLMRFRLADPPALLSSTLGDLNALTGASELIFDTFITPGGLPRGPRPRK